MYLVWRKMGIPIDEWVKLPWWQQQVVLDGLEWEAEANSEDGEGGGGGKTNEADVTDMDRFEALTKNQSMRKKGFGPPKP